MNLASLPPLLRDEPSFSQVVGRSNAVLAVPEAARPLVLAGLTHRTSRRPLVVACPTGTMAGQVADDLAQFLPDDDVVLFPAWETLPFERVSPSVETMGRRSEVLWRLADPQRSPAVVVGSVRSLLQHLAPTGPETEPVRVAPGDVLDPEALLERLVIMGYRPPAPTGRRLNRAAEALRPKEAGSHRLLVRWPPRLTTADASVTVV